MSIQTTRPVESAPHAAPQAQAAGCENCGTALQGHYCHACGQSAHSPIRNFAHAVEEVFESFWHLDGRIFRTLRDLFVPGRVARGYLAGHRVRYIAPLRLFVILSLLTFFMGKLLLHVEPRFSVGGEPVTFGADQSIAEVERRRDRLLAALQPDQAEEDARSPGANPVLVATRARIQGQAAARIAQLRERTDARAAQRDGEPAAAASSNAASPSAASPSAASPSAAASPAASPSPASSPAATADAPPDCGALVADSRQAAWVPGFAARWVKERVRRGCDNLRQADTQGERLFQSFLAAVPTALFFLMPVFALLLKLVYLGSGTSYLEHLVVALYSHAFLLLMLLALFLLSAAGNAGAPQWLTGIGYAVAWVWLPIYLWKSQRRVYGGGWLPNLLRFLLIGTVYLVLLSLAIAYAGLMGMSS